MHSLPSDGIDSRLTFNNILGRKKPLEQKPIAQGGDFDMYYSTGQRGKCIILDYKSFASQHILQRTWSKLDVDRLKTTFKKLNFSIQHYEDLSFSKTIELLRTESKRPDNKNFDYFVFCLLSHQAASNYGRIQFECSDQGLGVELAIDQLTKPTSTMAGKPKIFLIEAGDDYSPMSQSLDRGNTTLCHDSTHSPETKCRQYLIPRYSDCCIFYLTFSGYSLARLEENGSDYIRIMCDTLRDHSHEYDLMTLLTIVARIVQNANSELHSSRGSTALVQIISTLTRLVRL